MVLLEDVALLQDAIARYVGVSPRRPGRLFGVSLGQSPAAFRETPRSLGQKAQLH